MNSPSNHTRKKGVITARSTISLGLTHILKRSLYALVSYLRRSGEHAVNAEIITSCETIRRVLVSHADN